MASSSRGRHVPQRTCIATRRTLPASHLLRCVARPAAPTGWSIIPDPTRTQAGRGAWITPTTAALNTARARRAFERALRLPSAGRQPLDYSALDRYLASLDKACGSHPDTGGKKVKDNP